jgi:hypothetical protein
MQTEEQCSTYIHFHIKSSWPEQSFIQVISPIGCTKNNHTFILMEAEIHQGKVLTPITSMKKNNMITLHLTIYDKNF